MPDSAIRRVEAESKSAEVESQRAEIASKRAELQVKQAELTLKRAEIESKRAEIESQRAQVKSKAAAKHAEYLQSLTPDERATIEEILEYERVTEEMKANNIRYMEKLRRAMLEDIKTYNTSTFDIIKDAFRGR
ncbi:hypothetical protein DFS34DRAFT_634921 [Phlyctochytrium arcticum]|nr:hypothetical protein DFS34DRAFT_639880 [Phlyctochytrium arcticum]KAI9091506.1 hypothetical protein DFS34DRAFT_634921 [Phlyctochytrium arcticum]